MIDRVQTARLELRRCREADLDTYCRRIYADPDVMRTLPAGKPLPMDVALVRARALLVDHWLAHGFGPWLVESRATGRILGHCGLRFWPDTDDVEVLYALEPAAWGRGLASEAAGASAAAAFDDLGLERIIGGVLPGNVASERVLLRLGMTRYGTLDLGGRVVEMFELVARDWRAR